MDKSCKEIEHILVDYADGQLSPDDSSEVTEHLNQCEGCRKVLDALQRSLELAGVIWTDALSETENIRISTSCKVRKFHWFRYAAIAASILLVVTASVVWRVLTKPVELEIEPSFAEIERKIMDESTATKLLAASDLLASKAHTRELAKNQYEYIVVHYPKTKAAATAKMKIQ